MSKNNNPLLQELGQSELPGVAMTLPSGGAFYDERVLRGSADIEVRSVSLVDELNFKDPFKVVSGEAVTEVIRRCAPGIAQPMRLSKIDVDAVLIAARIASHGKTAELELTCQNEEKKLEDGTVGQCGYSGTAEVDLRKVLMAMAPIPGPDSWKLTLPNGHVVQCRPLPYESVVRSMRTVTDQIRDAKQLELNGKSNDIGSLEQVHKTGLDRNSKIHVEMLVSSIWYVQTLTGERVYDYGMLMDYLVAIPPAWILSINDMMDRLAELTKPYGTIDFRCPECEHESRVPVNMDPTGFFSEPSRKGTSRTSSASTTAVGRRPTRS